jgi:signal transduction histidine kinase
VYTCGVKPRPPIRPLSRHLVLVLVGALLPVVVFAVAVTLRLSAQERAAVERRVAQSARVLALDVEREMSGTIRTLSALAGSESLELGHLASFHAEARRAAATQPSWLTVLLLDPDGRQLVNTRVPWGESLPAAHEPESLRRVVETRAPVVGDLARGPKGNWAFPVRVPVLRDGEVRYVLTAAVSALALTDMVAATNPLEQEWTRTLVDRYGVVAARTREPARFVGRAGTPPFLRAIARADEGVYHDTTLDGADGVVAFSRAPASGWTAVVVVPRELVLGAGRRLLGTVGAIGLLLLLVGGAGAFVLSRRVARAIESAADAADALAHGGCPELAPSGVAEIARLGEALERSAALLARRSEERDDHLARAEAARAEAEAASRAKDEFVAMLGHELRNPLSPIVTALEILALRGEAGTREHAVIKRQVHHLVRLVDDLLDVSRITRGKVALQREPLEIAEVVAQAVEMASPLLEQHRHRLEVDVPARGLGVSGDRVRLAQVVSNLLNNAARYTPPGGNVQVRAAREGDEVVLSVSDDGRGLPAEMLSRVFDLFVQGPRTPDRHEGGLGIGLTVVRTLVVMHGGRVEARSDGPGRGSAFVVRLPCAAKATPAVEPRPADAGRAAQPLRVLVVDDNADAAELLASLFRARGHEVRVAFDGPGALAVVDGWRPQVAVLDIGLPVMDGYELAGRLRERLGAGAPPMFAVTGYGQERDAERSLEAGFRTHFVKPVDGAALLRAVESLMN